MKQNKQAAAAAAAAVHCLMTDCLTLSTLYGKFK
jgi:hypothetical protein